VRLSERDRWVLESTAALAALVFVAARPATPVLLRAAALAIGGGLRSSVELTAVDAGTWRATLATSLKAALLLAPLARAWVRVPRLRLWLPHLVVAFPAALGLSLPAVSTWPMWLSLAVASAAGLLLATRPWLRALALLPWLVVVEPSLSHSPLSDLVWTHERLFERCAGNDGARPVDLTPDVVGTRYYSATPVSAELMLVTGDRHAFWARRGADGSVRLGAEAGPRGNLWQGCTRDDTVWLTKRGMACWAKPSGDSGCVDAPGPPELGLELDYSDVVCNRASDSLYLGQLLRGGVLEVTPQSGATLWHPVMPGLNLQLVPRSDGKLVGITTSRLFVLDPQTDAVRVDEPAGAVAMGVDVCPADDAAVVADFAGRVRLFDRSGEAYVFRAGIALPAPRRVAFSPGCDRIVVTSGDDRSVFVLRRLDLSLLRTYRVGPGLRDVTFLDEKTAVAVDGCTVNLLDAAP
jgi:hypothetical protein